LTEISSNAEKIRMAARVEAAIHRCAAAAEPDLTLEEIRSRLKSEKRLKTGTTSVWRFYERHDITFKKNSARRRTGSS
jgi:transposase